MMVDGRMGQGWSAAQFRITSAAGEDLATCGGDSDGRSGGSGRHCRESRAPPGFNAYYRSSIGAAGHDQLSMQSSADEGFPRTMQRRHPIRPEGGSQK
jgi:hypothetical protein